jgi:hypothetical protein
VLSPLFGHPARHCLTTFTCSHLFSCGDHFHCITWSRVLPCCADKTLSILELGSDTTRTPSLKRFSSSFSEVK